MTARQDHEARLKVHAHAAIELSGLIYAESVVTAGEPVAALPV